MPQQKNEELWDAGMTGHASEVIDGKQYFASSEGVFSYTLSTGKIEYKGPGTAGFRTGAKTLVTLDRNDDGVEEPYLFTYGGNPMNPRLYNFTSFKKISTSGLFLTQYEGAGGSSINIGTSYDDVLYIGAWNNWNCAAFDTETETVISRYVTGGQTDSQTGYVDEEDKFHLISGNYSACVVYEIDPLNKTGYDGDEETNIISPLITKMKSYQQKRIHMVTAGDGYVFAGTIPTSYVYGGGIGVYNTKTKTEDFIRFTETSVKGEKVVPNSELWDLSINGLVYYDGLLYGTTSNSGGTGTSAKTNLSSQIFVFDYKNMKVEAILDLREYIPQYLPHLVDTNGDGKKDTNDDPSPIRYIGGITVDDQGRLWSMVSDVLFCFTYDKSEKTFQVQVIKDISHSSYTTSSNVSIRNRRAAFDPASSSVFMSFYGSTRGTHQIKLEDWTAPVGSIVVQGSQQIMDARPETFAMGANNNLYYASGTSLYMLPVNVTESDWVTARALDARISALGDVSLASADEIAAIREDYKKLSLRNKALVQKELLLQEAEAEILELKIAAATDKISASSLTELAEMIDSYSTLNSRQQRYVKNYETLMNTYDTAVEFAQNEAANTVQEQIFALNVNSRRDEVAVVATREAYEALPEDSRALVNTKYLTAAEEKLEEIKNNTSYGAVNENEAVAEVNGAYFVTLEEAFHYQVVNSKETVKLICDIWEKDLVFPSSAILDLNGYQLTVDSILTYESNKVIDSSTDNSGVLKIKGADGNMLSSNNAQLPLYDSNSGGYRFFELRVESVTVTGKINPKYWFKVSAVNFDEIYKLIREGSVLNIAAKLTWTGGEADAAATMEFTKQWADMYSTGDDFYITVSAVNTEDLEGFSLTPCVEANGVSIMGDAL